MRKNQAVETVCDGPAVRLLDKDYNYYMFKKL